MKLLVGRSIIGLSYDDGRLYFIERLSGSFSYALSVYQIYSSCGNVTLVDRLELGISSPPPPSFPPNRFLPQLLHPRIEHHSKCIYIPWGDSVCVAHLDGDRLVRQRALKCVQSPRSVAVMSPDIPPYSIRSLTLTLIECHLALNECHSRLNE